ncbi:hypothetical protein EON65_02395 [archaeon]|nr:MAG: hypothetical protein EON65_02395 [archaeon]
MKVKHAKFEDGDFGPKPNDEYGAVSFYGSAKPDPAGSKYPAPETLRWERPQYADDKFDEKKISKATSSSIDEEEEDVEEDYDEEENEDEDDDYGLSFATSDAKVCVVKTACVSFLVISLAPFSHLKRFYYIIHTGLVQAWQVIYRRILLW